MGEEPVRTVSRQAESVQRTNHDVLKLHVAGMALQSDVALAPARAVRRDGVIGNELAIECYLYQAAGGLDLKCIPLTSGLGCEGRGRREGVHGTGLV